MNERDIFIAALQRQAPAERRVYLDEACGDDATLRRGVEALLEKHELAGSFLESPAAAPAATLDEPAITERPGTVVGPYKLLEEIGEGGFGIVFMAEQQKPLRRRVALKVLKPGMDTRQVVARFEAERQALALMDHPNIARVHDGGETAGGRPYFVMELVKGTPITEYCDQAQLAPRQRLELFVTVCQAVQHAHQKGIIHRDLKPSNVMVALHDGTPVVKVIDFGIAKATVAQLTDKTLFTAFAQMMGTPLYMSPEQAGQSSLDVDTRSDIYSLGVLLYELLTGTTPFDKKRLKEASYDEIRRIIREEEAARPSTRLSTLGAAAATVSGNRRSDPRRLSQLIRGDLDWIVMKALEKDRNRRYETASAFAADVQRYLRDEPVAACSPSAWYRSRKFARRNKAALLTAATVVLAVLLAVGGLAGSIGWAVRDRDARRATTAEQVNLALNEASVLQGQQKWREALAAVKRAKALLASGGGDTELHSRAQELGNDVEMAVQLDDLRSQKRYYDNAGFKVGNARAATAYARAFEAYGIDVLGDPPEQVAASIQARSIREQLVAALDDWILVPDAGVRERLRAIAKLADPDEWRNRMRQAVVANDRRALEELAARPEVASFRPASGYLLAQALSNAGAGPQAIQVLTVVQQRYPQDFWLNFQLGCQFLWGPGVQHRPDAAAGYLRAALVARPDDPVVYTYLALALPGPEHLDEIIALNRKAIEIAPTYDSAHRNLGAALQEQGRPAEAEAEFREALRLRPDLPNAHFALGNALKHRGKMAEAEAEFRQALRLRPDYPEAHINLGGVLYGQGKLAEAEVEDREALRLRPDLPEAHQSLGTDLMDRGKLAEAAAEYREALRLRPDYPEAHNSLGFALAGQGKLPEAEAEYREALRLRPDYPEAHYGLSAALGNQGKHAEAEAEGRQALRLRPDAPEAHYNLGIALNNQGNPAAAAAEYREALRLRPDYPEAHNSLGFALAGQGKLPEAEAEYREALRLRPDYPEAHLTRLNLGNALVLQGKGAAAEVEFRHALRLRPEYVEAHLGLGTVLSHQAKHAEAEAEYREALRHRPDYPEAHYCLGSVLNDQAKHAEAEAEHREALRLRPEFAEAHCNLASALKRQGRFAEALVALKRGHQLGSRQPAWRYPSAQWVRQVEQLVALDAKLPQILRGAAQPAGAAERLALAQLCQNFKKLYAAAARFYGEAFAAEPKLADDLRTAHRYNAACAAALAGCGQGEDAAPLDDAERARLRRQALGWLRADLAAWGQLLEKEPEKTSTAVQQTLQHWLQDTDIAGVRGDALAKLPEAERKPWQQLWADVEEILKKTNHKDTKDTKKKSPN